MLKSGWAKLKELKREPTEEDLKKREAENEAKSAGKGLWNPHGQKVCSLFRSRSRDEKD
jgi:staphylococcal nuclease domain-containing protein 1